MPKPHIYEVIVRHYECDAHGRVHPAVLLNYMQEAAFAGSASVGYSARRYEEIGLAWLAYETDLNILKRVTYGDALKIHTWVHDFRRVRSLRQYELYHEGALIGHGSTDWVLLDTVKQYPATIPPEIITAYSQGQDIREAPPRPPFAKIPAPPAHAFKAARRVELRDIDTANHVNNAVYLQYMADAEQLALAAQGWDASALAQHEAAVIVTRHEVAYKIAAVLNDALTVTTWTADVTPQGGTRYTIITRDSDNKLITQIRSEFAWAHARTGAALPMPESFIQRA